MPIDDMAVRLGYVELVHYHVRNLLIITHAEVISLLLVMSLFFG